MNFNQFETMEEADWAIEFMTNEGIIPDAEENPVGVTLNRRCVCVCVCSQQVLLLCNLPVPLADSLVAGVPKSQFKFAKRWQRVAHIMALPYLFFGFVYRGLWLPQHQGHLKAVAAAPSVNIDTAFYCEPFAVFPAAAWGCEALVSVLPFLHGNNTAQCLEHVYPSDTHFGACLHGHRGHSRLRRGDSV